MYVSLCMYLFILIRMLSKFITSMYMLLKESEKLNNQVRLGYTAKHWTYKHHLIRKNRLTRFVNHPFRLVIGDSNYRSSRFQENSIQVVFYFTLNVYMYYVHTFLGIHRVQISDLWIAYLRIGFVFSRITWSNFLWNLQIKTSFLLDFLSPSKPRVFCLHFKLDNLFILYSKMC